MGKLHNIGLELRTDKSYRHHYLDIYEKYISYLADNNISLLEIGFKEGYSAAMWEKYFTNPKSKFYSVDLKYLGHKASKKTKLIIADQSKRKDLTRVAKYGPFDIIIDDGSHIVNHQQISFGYLFKYVKPGGLYVIEDLFLASVSPKIHNPSGTAQDTLHLCESLIKSGVPEGKFLLQSEKEYISKHVSKCVLEDGRKSKICFIIKK